MGALFLVLILTKYLNPFSLIELETSLTKVKCFLNWSIMNFSAGMYLRYQV